MSQFGHNVIGDGAGIASSETTEAINEVAVFVQRCNEGEVVILPKFLVLRAASRGNVYQAGAFGLADLLPGDDLVGLGGRPAAASRAVRENTTWGVLCRQLVERAAIGEVKEIAARRS